MRLPRALQGHTITVEHYLGSDATGPLYGPPADRRCLVEQKRVSMRKPDGRTVVASSVIRTDLDYDLAPEDRITYRGRAVEVVSVAHYSGGGLGTPDHTEIAVQ